MRTTYCLLLCVVCLFAFLWIADGLRPEENAAKTCRRYAVSGQLLTTAPHLRSRTNIPLFYRIPGYGFYACS